MNYQLIVKKQEENPSFKKELVAWEERSQRGYGSGPGQPPEQFRTVDTLTVTINEDQWKAIQKSVLETFK